MSEQAPRVPRRAVIGGALAAAGSVAAAAASGSAAASPKVVHGGLAEVISGSVEQLTVRTHDGVQLTVGTRDFSPDWTFEAGDLVLLVPAGTSAIEAMPYMEVDQRPKERDVVVFNSRRGRRVARVVRDD